MGCCSDKTKCIAKWAQRVACTDHKRAISRSVADVPKGGSLKDERLMNERFGMRDRDVNVGNRAPPRDWKGGCTWFPAITTERSGGMR
jgi:hypothetical protein